MGKVRSKGVVELGREFYSSFSQWFSLLPVDGLVLWKWELDFSKQESIDQTTKIEENSRTLGHCFDVYG